MFKNQSNIKLSLYIIYHSSDVSKSKENQKTLILHP